MIHHYISNDTSGDHFGVSVSESTGLILVQLQDKGEQVRVAMSPERARNMAALLLKSAELMEISQSK